jgi:hypothetical protein
VHGPVASVETTKRRGARKLAKKIPQVTFKFIMSHLRSLETLILLPNALMRYDTPKFSFHPLYYQH